MTEPSVEPAHTRSLARSVLRAGALAALLALTVLAVRGVVASLTPAESYLSGSAARTKAPGAPLPVLWTAPSFDLPDQSGGRVSTASLKGKVTILNFIFTQCTSICPMMTANLVQLEKAIESPAVRFVSVSVDPAHDTPEVLAAYAQHWPPEPRWSLLSTTPAQITDLARGMRVAVAPSGDPSNPIVHSRLLSLIDAEGRVRGIYDSDDLTALAAIESDVKQLIKEMPASAAETLPVLPKTETPPPLARFGCNGCHERPELAPPWQGGANHQVRLATGETVALDAAYLRESNLKPRAKMVAGYAPLMPSYEGMLSEDDIAALVSAIQSQAENVPSGMNVIAATGPAEDPICHMQVATTDPSLRLIKDGREFHFCSRSCLEQFQKQDPK